MDARRSGHTAGGEQDYDGFYKQELELRRLRRCPPFSDFIFITAVGPDETMVLKACMRMRHMLEGWLSQPPYAELEIQILGPAPAVVAKVNNRFRYRLTLCARNTKQLRTLIAHLLRTAQTEKEPEGSPFLRMSTPRLRRISRHGTAYDHHQRRQYIKEDLAPRHKI
jgi:primosomal protein N'